MREPLWTRHLQLEQQRDGSFKGELLRSELEFCDWIGQQRHAADMQSGRRTIYGGRLSQEQYNARGMRGEVFVGLLKGQPPKSLLWPPGEYNPGPDFDPFIEVKTTGSRRWPLRVHERQARRYDWRTNFVLVASEDPACWVMWWASLREVVRPELRTEDPERGVFYSLHRGHEFKIKGRPGLDVVLLPARRERKALPAPQPELFGGT